MACEAWFMSIKALFPALNCLSFSLLLEEFDCCPEDDGLPCAGGFCPAVLLALTLLALLLLALTLLLLLLLALGFWSFLFLLAADLPTCSCEPASETSLEVVVHSC